MRVTRSSHGVRHDCGERRPVSYDKHIEEMDERATNSSAIR